MKLEPKHICAYFQYGLNVLYNGSFYEVIAINETEVALNGIGYVDINDVKLLLRPLSDLTTNHVDDSPYFTKLELEEAILNQTCPAHIWLDAVKEKFDVFELIPNGLAINLNTINQNEQ